MTQSYRDYVSSKLARYEKVVVHAPDRRGRSRPKVEYRKVKDGWGPAEALTDAKRRDQEDPLYYVAILVRLCNDERARAMPEHALIHQLSGIVGCCGEQMYRETAKSLGISDVRAAAVSAFVDQELAAFAGLTGSA